MDTHKWIDKQTKALIDAGVNPVDAARSAKWAIDTMPAGSDPDTWIPTVLDIAENPDDETVLHDTRVAWYADDSIPAKFKRLLDATVVSNGE